MLGNVTPTQIKFSFAQYVPVDWPQVLLCSNNCMSFNRETKRSCMSVVRIYCMMRSPSRTPCTPSCFQRSGHWQPSFVVGIAHCRDSGRQSHQQKGRGSGQYASNLTGNEPPQSAFGGEFPYHEVRDNTYPHDAAHERQRVVFLVLRPGTVRHGQAETDNEWYAHHEQNTFDPTLWALQAIVLRRAIGSRVTSVSFKTFCRAADEQTTSCSC